MMRFSLKIEVCGESDESPAFFYAGSDPKALALVALVNIRQAGTLENYHPRPIPSRRVKGRWVPLPVPTACDK